MTRFIASRTALRAPFWCFAAPLIHMGVVSAATLHTNDFQTGLAGWQSGGSLTSRQPGGGPNGAGDAFFQVRAGGGNLAGYNSTAAWTGNFAAIGAAMVSADLMAPAGSAPLNIRLVLFGPGTIPNFAPRWTSTAAATVPSDGVWRNYNFSLAEDDLTLVVPGSSGEDYDDLMNGVLRVMLRHNSGGPAPGGSPVNGTLGIDNVSLRGPNVPLLAGDYNDDAIVNSADYTRWRDALGLPAGTLPNDVDEGVIGSAQYDTWKANFGAVAAASTHSALPSEFTGGPILGQVIPEPAALTLLAAGLVGWVPVGRRWR